MDISTVNPVNGSGGTAGVAGVPPPVDAAAAGQIEQKNRGKAEQALSLEQTEALAEGLNEMMDGLQTNIGFSIHEGEENQVVVQIKDRKTDELIKQIPSEELLVIKEKMEELSGLILDRHV
jgi:flagellar protein FlaG